MRRFKGCAAEEQDGVAGGELRWRRHKVEALAGLLSGGVWEV